MSDTETEVPTTGRRRSARPQREVHREGPSVQVESPQEGRGQRTEVVDVVAQMRAKDSEIAAERQRAERAEAARIAAEVNARQQQTTDRKAALAESIASAKAEGEAAAAAYRQAREAGDVDAEIVAQRKLTSAEQRFNTATAELAQINAQPAAAQPQRQGPSPQAQRWMDEHPRLKDDRDYLNYALLMDQYAVSKGHPAGSQAYVDYIEQEMRTRFGDNHAVEGSKGTPMASRDHRDRYADGGDVSAPTGNTGGGRSGHRLVRYPLGDMRVRQGPNGSQLVTYEPSYGKSAHEIERDYDEAAKTNFPKIYERDKAAAIGMVLEEAIAASDEGMTDLKVGDGQRWGRGNLDNE